jgi:hypothetical protein
MDINTYLHKNRIIIILHIAEILTKQVYLLVHFRLSELIFVSWKAKVRKP